MKTCSKCKEEKELTEFRTRKGKTNTQSTYFNNACRKCESYASAEYYQKVKGNDAFKIKNCKRVRNWRIKTGDSKKRWLKNKNNKFWIDRLKKWRIDNKEKVVELQRKRAKKWFANAVENISDSYCMSKIIDQTGMERSHITQEMIEIKRLHILINRN